MLQPMAQGNEVNGDGLALATAIHTRVLGAISVGGVPADRS